MFKYILQDPLPSKFNRNRLRETLVSKYQLDNEKLGINVKFSDNTYKTPVRVEIISDTEIAIDELLAELSAHDPKEDEIEERDAFLEGEEVNNLIRRLQRVPAVQNLISKIQEHEQRLRALEGS